MHYMMPKPLDHPVLQSVCMREKAYSIFILKDEGIAAKGNN